METVLLSPFVRELNEFTPCLEKMHLERMQELTDTILRFSAIHFTKAQCQKVEKALQFSAYIHRGEYRNDDITPYFLHLLEATNILIEENVADFKILVATILHDTVEKAKKKTTAIARIDKIAKEFGSGVGFVVDPISKRIGESREENFRRILATRNRNVRWRSIVLKFVDRVHNMRTLNTYPFEKRPKKINETEHWFPILEEKLRQDLVFLHKRNVLHKEEYLNLPDRLQKLLDKALAPYVSQYPDDESIKQELGI